MVLRFFRPGGDDRLEGVERTVRQMLDDNRHAFDAATSAVLAGASVEVVGPDLLETDRRINDAEREVRRELVVHASVRGDVEIPAMLAYMSIVKDLERVGDYAKNIFDLADTGVDLSEAEDRDELVATRDRVSRMIAEVGAILEDRDEEQAWALIGEGDEMLDDFDARVEDLINSQRRGNYAVPRALYFRHTKRVVAHLMNVLSSVVMPLDQLDYFDEDRATRHSGDVSGED